MTHNLTEYDQEELEMEICFMVGNYLYANAIKQHDSTFFDTLVNYATDEYIAMCSTLQIYDSLDEYDEEYAASRIIVSKYVREYLKIMGIRRREYLHPRPHHYEVREDIAEKIAACRAAYQPAQRTPEWYAFRNNLVTASNIWKIFSSAANYNSLVCEKCRPLPSVADPNIQIVETSTHINVDSPLHWGVKYEPLSVAIYEYRNKCVVGQFGCIQHPQIACLGASPDGIVVSPTDSPEYGMMLEIKNVVNREITGVPSMPYWVQMQVQMEVCDLNNCHFVETQFREHAEAVTTADDDAETKFYTSIPKYLYNGVILYFVKRDFVDNSPKYMYMPLDIPLEKPAIEAWIAEKKRELGETHVLYRRIYWYCETFSCVLVTRNCEWFNAAKPLIREFWDVVLKERATGHEHRLPKKRPPKTPTSGGCVIQLLDI
jgi:putative phage-type endonuclease